MISNANNSNITDLQHPKSVTYLLLFFLALQLMFWSKTNHIKPDMVIVSNPPRQQTVDALSLGDKQFYFRTLAFHMQNMGDTWGRFTPLKDYDYAKLERWFFLLDSLDNKSNFVASIASYYYSQSQNPADTIHVINYLREHYKSDPVTKWWWLSQAVYIANHRLKDKELALELAYELANLPPEVKMPLWGRQMPAFIHEQLGENKAAQKIIVDILANYENLEEGELNFMENFITERMKDKKFKFEVYRELARKRRNPDFENQ
jgi:hypothetical protein